MILLKERKMILILRGLFSILFVESSGLFLGGCHVKAFEHSTYLHPPFDDAN